MKFPSIFKNKAPKQPYCHWPLSLSNQPQPQPLSLDDTQNLRSLFLRSANFSSDQSDRQTQSVLDTNKVRLSERLFFEPQETKYIVKESKTGSPFKGSVALEMESDEPHLDFKKSMQEIIESEGIILWKDWECLEKLLGWYLRVNGKENHSFIVGAFVDLLLGFSAGKTPDTAAYYSNASSSFPSPVVGDE